VASVIFSDMPPPARAKARDDGQDFSAGSWPR